MIRAPSAEHIPGRLSADLPDAPAGGSRRSVVEEAA